MTAADAPSAPLLPADLYADCARPQQSQAGPGSYPAAAAYPQHTAAAAAPGTPPPQARPPCQLSNAAPPSRPPNMPSSPPAPGAPFPGAPPPLPSWMVAPPQPYANGVPPAAPPPAAPAYSGGQGPDKQQAAWDAASPLMAGLVGAGVGLLAGELLSHRHHHHRRHYRFW